MGVGPGNDGFYYAKYAPYAIGGLIDKGIVLNNNLKILTDSGILGFVCYLFLLLYPAYYYFIKHHMYCKSCKNNFIEALINSLFTSEILLVSLTFTSQVEFFQPLFWLIYSMLIASINLKKHLLLQNKHMET